MFKNDGDFFAVQLLQLDRTGYLEGGYYDTGYYEIQVKESEHLKVEEMGQSLYRNWTKPCLTLWDWIFGE